MGISALLATSFGAPLHCVAFGYTVCNHTFSELVVISLNLCGIDSAYTNCSGSGGQCEICPLAIYVPCILFHTKPLLIVSVLRVWEQD